MWIRSIRYHNFRNIQNTEFILNPGLQILFGNNGQGKTNFIEGLFLCLTGESFRFGDHSDLMQFGQNQTSIIMEVDGSNFYELKLTIENGRKVHWLNGKKVSVKQLVSVFPTILFSPESLTFVKEGSSERRDLVDEFLISCPDLKYQKLFDDYTNILRTKNKVLKSFSNQIISKEQAEDLLSSYEEAFIKLAVEVTLNRILGLNRIADYFKLIGQSLYSQAFPVDISVEYLISGKNATHYNQGQIEQNIRSRLSELRSAELATGHSLSGPHKHDINFLINNRSSRIFCSQGQQRTLILAFKLAQMVYHTKVYGTVPILFLDDVLSELDSSVRANLVRILKDLKGQIFITTTDQHLCQDLSQEKQRYISVSNGNFSFL